jgi:hypothetical protein
MNPAMTQLRLVPMKCRHDLPPLWDGRRVDWQGWTSHASSARFHNPPKCHSCGSAAEASVNLGVVHPLPGETMESVRKRTLPSGRTYDQRVTVSASPVILLAAFRCPDCGHDSVHDNRDDSYWDLDEQDYGDEGSTDGMLPLML